MREDIAYGVKAYLMLYYTTDTGRSAPTVEEYKMIADRTDQLTNWIMSKIATHHSIMLHT